jgi:hypothetical protein
MKVIKKPAVIIGTLFIAGLSSGRARGKMIANVGGARK